MWPGQASMLVLLSVTREVPSPGEQGLMACARSAHAEHHSEEGAAHGKPVRGLAQISSTQSPRGRRLSRAPTRCCSGPRGCHARLSRQAELSKGVWSGRREAGHLPFWTGVAPRGPGISLIQDHGLLGGDLLCAGLICEGLSTWGLLAGFTR